MKAHHRETRDSLAGSRLTNNSYRLPAINGEIHAINSLNDSVFGRKRDFEVFDGK